MRNTHPNFLENNGRTLGVLAARCASRSLTAALCLLACAAAPAETAAAPVVPNGVRSIRGISFDGFAWEHPLATSFLMPEGGREVPFEYGETLARAEVNGQGNNDPKIPLNILFSPLPGTYLGGKLLGQGWWFPAFESTLLQTDARTYVMGLPNGEKVTLHKKGNSLSGGGWTGTVGAHETVFKTSGGWSAKFQLGRLVELTSPKREHSQFAIDRDGVRTITHNGRVVLTLTRKIDEKTTFPVYLVSYVSQGKSRKAELHIGHRPILVKYVEKENARDVPKERTEDTSSLSSTKVEGQPEKKFNFGIDTLTVGNSFFKWHKTSAELLQKDQEEYSTVVIRGIKCRKTRYADGSSALHGSANGAQIQQLRHSRIEIIEKTALPVRDGIISAADLMNELSSDKTTRTISYIDERGQEVLAQRFWRDENGNTVRTWIANEKAGTMYEKKDGKIFATDVASKSVLWIKEYDASGRIVSLSRDGTTFLFNYGAERVKITRQNSKGTTEKEVSYNQFSSIVQDL